MSDDSKNLSRVEDILSGEDYIPIKPMSRIEKLLLEGGGPGGKLPEVTSDDNGKILKVKDGAWDKGEDISGDKLPQVSSSDNGKVLKVVQGEWNIDKDEGDRLPTVTSVDEGKVLKVKNGAWDKDVPEKELPETTSEDSGKALMINDNGDWAKSDIPDPAITAEASGDTASFSDGSNLPMPKLEVAIEPVQDLHGYDSPWVGGVGKNKLPNSSTDSKSVNSLQINNDKNGKYTISGTATANTFIDFDLADSYVIKSGDYLHFMNSATNSNASFTLMDGSTIGFSAVFSSANRIMDLSNYVGSTVNKIRFYFNANQGMTGTMTPMIVNSNIETTFAPYENICPISGWSACNVVRCGKNLFGGDKFADDVVRKVENASKRPESKTCYYAADKINKVVLFTEFKPSTRYSFYFPTGSQSTNLEIVYSDGSFTTIGTTGVTVSTESKNVIALRGTWYTGTTTIDYEYCGIIEGVCTVDDFLANTYNGQTYTIQFKDGDNPLTVYGGTLDVDSGVLTVTDAYCSESLTWHKNTQFGYTFFNATTLSGKKQNVACNYYKAVNKARDELLDGEMGTWNTTNSFGNVIRDDSKANLTEEEFTTAMSGLTFTYKLATPTTIQLTPTQVKSLLGSNNVWCDTGEIESLIYYKQNAEDIADLIETLVPEELPAITPSDNDKILTAYGGEWVPKTNPLPDARNYEAGSVLTVRNNHWSPELLPATPGVPRVESDDVGKVLKATGVDTYDWANGTDIIQTTQESYDAMSDSQKMNGKLYFVHNESDDEDAAIYFMNKCYSKAPIPDINAVQVPPVIFDNGSLKKINDVNEFPGLEKIYTTPTKYNALSDDEKNDLSKIYYVSEYEFKSYEDGKIVVRTDSNSNVLFFFNGIVQINGVPLTLPSGLENYVPGYPDTTAYASDGVTSVGYLGINWSGDNTKYFVQAGRHNGNMINNLPTYAVINPAGGYGQELPYTNPYDVPNGFIIYYGGKQYTEYKIPTPDINAVQVPPVIFDNGSLKKVNDVVDFPGLEKIYTTPTKYAALNEDEKKDLSKIYYVSDYEFYKDPDNPVVVRVGANDDIKWFFNGYTFASGNRYEVPENLREFQAPLNAQGTRHVRCDSTPYASADATEPISSDYFVGWSNYDQLNQMRYSRISGSMSILNGTVYAVIDPNGGAGQSNPYTDPYDISGGFIIYYGGKQYSEYEPAKPYVELTQAEYDALPSSKESDGKMHFITDTGKIILNGIQYG